MTLSADHLLQEARRRCGIDIDDVDAVEPLTVLIDSLHNDAQMSASGEVEMERRLLRILVNRLRMERDFRAHPEIEEQQIISPIIIPSLPRTGSTKLQKLLSSLDEFTALPFWMGHNPSLISGRRDEDRQPRIDDTIEYEQWLEATIPATKSIHPYQAYETEEPNPLQEHSMISQYLIMFVFIPGYFAWLRNFDPDITKQLRHMKRMLKYLQWQFGIDSSAPWILKNPAFLGHEISLLKVFPDAKLITTHRHPAELIASATSLVTTFSRLYSDTDWSAVMGPAMLQGQAALTDKQIDDRAANPDMQIMDIAYAELSRNSMATMEKIFAFIGKPFTERTRQQILDWEKNSPQDKYGKHKYALADFGLTEADVNHHFSKYLARFADCI